MSEQISISVIKAVKKAHERIMVFGGVVIGITLIGYFFSFAQLIDRGYMAAVWFQAFSSVAMVVALFYLKRLSFLVIKLTYGRREAYRSFLSSIVVSDLDKDAETLEKEFGSSGMHA